MVLRSQLQIGRVKQVQRPEKLSRLVPGAVITQSEQIRYRKLCCFYHFATILEGDSSFNTQN